MSKPNHLPAWQALIEHQQTMASLHMRDLFVQESHRFQSFSLKFEDILFD
jgi:glucose-6-phosphate isomerase